MTCQNALTRLINCIPQSAHCFECVLEETGHPSVTIGQNALVHYSMEGFNAGLQENVAGPSHDMTPNNNPDHVPGVVAQGIELLGESSDQYLEAATPLAVQAHSAFGWVRNPSGDLLGQTTVIGSYMNTDGNRSWTLQTQGGLVTSGPFAGLYQQAALHIISFDGTNVVFTIAQQHFADPAALDWYFVAGGFNPVTMEAWAYVKSNLGSTRVTQFADGVIAAPTANLAIAKGFDGHVDPAFKSDAEFDEVGVVGKSISVNELHYLDDGRTYSNGIYI